MGGPSRPRPRITQWVLPRPQDPDAGRVPWMDMCILEMMHALRTPPFDIHYAHLTPQRADALLRQHAEEICAEAWDRGTQGRRERHQFLTALPPSALPEALRHMAEMRQQTMADHMDALPPGHAAAGRAMHPLPMILPALATVLPPQELNDSAHPDAAPSHGPATTEQAAHSPVLHGRWGHVVPPSRPFRARQRHL